MQFSFSNLREHLFRQIHTSQFQVRYFIFIHRIGRDVTFPTPDLLLAYMHNPTEDASTKDDLLAGLFTEYRADPSSDWTALLLLVFLPMIENLHHCKRFYSKPDSLNDYEQDVLTCAIQALRKLDPSRRANNIAAKVKRDTRKRLFETYRLYWRYQQTYVGFDLADEAQHEPIYSLDTDYMEQLTDIASALKAGVVSASDFQILIRADVEGRPLRELAIEEGFSYEALKKRRQRAIAALRSFFQQDSEVD